jgi:catechol 2,3-dioxygenase-like lactoylglutathione lyase family enzyme
VLDSAQVIAFLPSTDLERSRRFYVDTLGLAFVDLTPFALVLRAGDGTMVRVARVDDLRPQPFTVFGWAVRDITEAVADLARSGVACVRYDGMGQDDVGVWTTPAGDRIAWFQDPDANTLSLTQFTA